MVNIYDKTGFYFLNDVLTNCILLQTSINKFQMYMSHLKTTTSNTLTSALNVKDFTKECLEICWYMVVRIHKETC